MSEWWTYRLSDLLMFSPETYYRLFELYNQAVWPAQLAALAAGIAILVLMLTSPPWAGRAIAVLLASAWLFVAYAYFHARYAAINLAAPYFAVAFAIEAMLLLAVGAIAARLSFARVDDSLGRAGRGLFIAGLAVPPVLGLVIGREWWQLEMFGIAPDPTVLATLGVLAAADRTRWELMVVPVLWCLISGATLWTMRQPDALILPVAAVFAVAIAFFRRMERPRQRSPET